MPTIDPPQSNPPTESDDQQFGRMLIRGAMIGTPIAFVLTFLIALLAAGWANATAIAIWPAPWGGPFLGGVIALAKGPSRVEAVTPIIALPGTAAPFISPQAHAAWCRPGDAL